MENWIQMPGNMNSRGRKGAGLSWTTILVVLNLIAFTLISLEHFIRFDFTETQMYTLNPDTIRILSKLKNRVTVKVFLSDDLPPGHEAIRGKIVDQLDEIQTAAGDMMNLIYLNPGPAFPEVIEEARGYGIKAESLYSRRADRSETVMGYLSLAVIYEDRFEKIQSLHYSASLEYDLLMKISRVIREVPVTIAFQELPQVSRDLTPEVRAQIEEGRKKKNRRSVEQQLGYVASTLKEIYDVITVDLTRPVPREVTTLVLTNMHLLDELAVYYADQFLMKGGKLVILKSGVRITSTSYKCKPDKGLLDEWLSNYGIVIDKNVICDKRCITYPFVIEAGDGRTFQKELAYSPYLQILRHFFDAAHPITAPLKNDMVSPFFSSIELTAPDGGKKTTLFQSSIKAWDQRDPDFEIHPDRIVTPDEGQFRQYPLCGLIEGTFSSYFLLRSLSRDVYRSATLAEKGIMGIQAKAVRMPLDPNAPAVEEEDAPDAPAPAPAPGEDEEEPEEPDGILHPKEIVLHSPETSILVIGNEAFLDPPVLSGLREETYTILLAGYQSTIQFFSNSVDYLSVGGEFNKIRARDVPRRLIDAKYKDKPNLIIKLIGTGGGVFVVLLIGIGLAFFRKISRRKEVTL